MVFSKEDKKRIGDNFAAIRLAYGFKSILDFSLELEHCSGLSYDSLKKIESGNYKELKDSTIRTYGALTGFTFREIVFDDLSYLEPNSLVFEKPDIRNAIYGEDTQEEYREFLKTVFPIVTTESALKSPDFRRAYSICVNKILNASFDESDVDKAINAFHKASVNNCLPEAYVNILSIIGCLYVHYVLFSMDANVWNKIIDDDYDGMVDFFKRLYKFKNYDKNAEFSSKIKRYFLDKYNNLLTTYMIKVNETKKYKDYAYYYLGIRYYFGIMDNDITKINDHDMNVFGHNMLDCLQIMKNKYAMNFFKVI